ELLARLHETHDEEAAVELRVGDQLERAAAGALRRFGRQEPRGGVLLVEVLADDGRVVDDRVAVLERGDLVARVPAAELLALGGSSCWMNSMRVRAWSCRRKSSASPSTARAQRNASTANTSMTRTPVMRTTSASMSAGISGASRGPADGARFGTRSFGMGGRSRAMSRASSHMRRW